MASLQPCFISRGTCRYGWQGLWGLMKRRVERSPATMELATLRSEISPLRFAAVEMTGVLGSVLVNLPPEMTVRCLPASSSRAGECAGMMAKILGPIETLSREISCHHGLATFRSEISPLRFAFAEMTGRYHIFLHGPFVFRTDAETVPPFIGLYQQRGEKAGPKSFLCRSAQSMEAGREGQKPS